MRRKRFVCRAENMRAHRGARRFSVRAPNRDHFGKIPGDPPEKFAARSHFLPLCRALVETGVSRGNRRSIHDFVRAVDRRFFLFVGHLRKIYFHSHGFQFFRSPRGHRVVPEHGMPFRNKIFCECAHRSPADSEKTIVFCHTRPSKNVSPYCMNI